MDLIQHRGGDDGGGLRGFGGVGYGGGFESGVPPHLGVCVRGQVADDLLGGYAGRDGALDGGFGHFGGDEVGVAGAKVGKEGKEGGLEGRGGVGVDAVVGFDYDEAWGGGGGGGGLGGGGGA